LGKELTSEEERSLVSGEYKPRTAGKQRKGKTDRSEDEQDRPDGEIFPFARKPVPTLFRAFERKSGPWASYHLLLVLPA
jgi:hypothetical protein